MDFKNIIYKTDSNVATITLNRPKKLNALNFELLKELEKALKQVYLDKEIKVLVITGEGEKAFAAGADIAELHENNKETGTMFSEFGSYVFKLIEQLEIPTIAAINGFALGGGCELALACDIRFASDNAKLGQPEVNLGIIPGYGGTQRLTHLVGKAKSLELILTGDIIDAEEAAKIGLVNSVFPSENLLVETLSFAKKIISKSRPVIAAARRAVNAASSLSKMEGLRFESELFGELCETEDFIEGTKAFIEKRKPEFKDR